MILCWGEVVLRAKEIIYYNGKLRGKYLSEDTCDKLDALAKLDVRRGCIKELKHIIWELSPYEIDVVRDLRSADTIELKKGTLSDLQTIGVAYMYYAKSLILGDSVGLGKTVQVCGLCNLLKALYEKEGMEFRFLYLTNKNLLRQAQDDFIKFTADYVDVLYGTAKHVNKFCSDNKANVAYSVVGSHSLLTSTSFQEFLVQYKRDNGCCPFDLLIIDEAGDILTNSSTKTYDAAMQIREMFDRVVLLNATPFEKELRMFYNQLHFVDSTFLPTKTAFKKEYEVLSYYGPYPRFSGDYKNQEKFRSLIGYRYFARTRKSSGAKMSNCSAELIISPLSPQQKDLLKKTSMPNMVYDCPSYFGMGIDTDEFTTPKMKDLIRLLTVDLKDVNSILIYSRYKESQDCIQYILNEYDIESAILNGDSSQEDRESIINCFKLGDIRVLITNVQKGLNFGNCNYCIFYSYDPNPNKMVQFEGRTTRSYNIDNKHVYLLISKGKELSTFKKVVADRAKASDVFAGSDFSCVLSILLNDDKLKSVK